MNATSYTLEKENPLAIPINSAPGNFRFQYHIQVLDTATVEPYINTIKVPHTGTVTITGNSTLVLVSNAPTRVTVAYRKEPIVDPPVTRPPETKNSNSYYWGLGGLAVLALYYFYTLENKGGSNKIPSVLSQLKSMK